MHLKNKRAWKTTRKKELEWIQDKSENVAVEGPEFLTLT